VPSRGHRAKPGALVEFAEVFEQLSLVAGLIAVAVLVVAGFVLPLVFSGQGGWAPLFATGGKYISWSLAFLVLVSALLGAARRLGDRGRFDSDVRVADLTWRQFEGYLAEYFRRRGGTVTHRGGAVSDGGVDLVVDDASGRRIVQAKHWKERRVGVVPLRALWGVLNDERADGAICVTSGEFTSDALAFVQGKTFELIDGTQLNRLIADVKSAGAAPMPAPAPASASAPVAAQPCPKCGRGVLQVRLARRGVNAGSQFLGCSAYPTCKYAANL